MYGFMTRDRSFFDQLNDNFDVCRDDMYTGSQRSKLIASCKIFNEKIKHFALAVLHVAKVRDTSLENALLGSKLVKTFVLDMYKVDLIEMRTKSITHGVAGGSEQLHQPKGVDSDEICYDASTCEMRENDSSYQPTKMYNKKQCDICGDIFASKTQRNKHRKLDHKIQIEIYKK